MAVAFRLKSDGITDSEAHLIGALFASHEKVLRAHYRIDKLAQAVAALGAIVGGEAHPKTRPFTEADEDQAVADGLLEYARVALAHFNLTVEVTIA